MEVRRVSPDPSLSPTKSLLTQPILNSTPTKNHENTEKSTVLSINLESSEPEESKSVSTQFEQLRAQSINEEYIINSRRNINRAKIPEFESVSKPEKRPSNQVLNVNPRKKLHENALDSSSDSSSYLQKAGNYVSGLLGNKKYD